MLARSICQIFICVFVGSFAITSFVNSASAKIVRAHFEVPTKRYPHAVLGDAIEYAALVIETSSGEVLRTDLTNDLVFEDIKPRLWDVTGDGLPEVVVVESHQSFGARLAIWNETGRLATTPYIGTRFRWLAPVGAADLDGDGLIEIAYVDRPHLAKTLRVWRYQSGTLHEVAALQGVTNHKIGWAYIEGGLRRCANQTEIILATGAWREIVAVRLESNGLNAMLLGAYSSAALKNALACK